MKGRKTLALILALLLALTLLSGCGTAAAPAAQPQEEEERALDPAGEQDSPAAAEAEEEYTLAPEEGCNQLTLYWSYPGGSYENCDVWVWFPGRDGHGELFHPCAYGAKVVLNVPQDVSEVGFIVRRDCSDPGGSSWGSATKDFDGDRFAEITGRDTTIYLKSGEQMQYTSRDGGVTLDPIRVFKLAGIQSPTEIRYSLSPAKRIASLDEVAVYDGDTRLALSDLSSLNNEVVSGTITLAEPLDLSHSYEVEIEGYGRIPALPTGIFDSQEFLDAYVYEGDDLGATVKGGKTVFKLWAPTASAVTLNLYEAGDGGAAFAEVPMTPGDKGVWSAEYDCGYGVYYTYSVTTALGTQEAVDPYARSAGLNGERGMVVDLRATDPEGFRASGYCDDIASYGDAVIWEVHVRDFSNALSSSRYPGKYLAFTEEGLTNAASLPAGLDYLKWLGITHVHLQPIYDFATVDEGSDAPQFNWGYDPKNYNVPEGSYATDARDGAVRVNELKQMVQSLHNCNIGVVMDVVDNHTYSLDSNLNKIVPYYYYRFAADGTPSNGSGCGNETASDRAMFRKYMVDSVCYWAQEYKIDGFRFDLMALHDLETMQAIESALHAINPKALIYGEGWSGGTSALRDKLQANQANIHQITASKGAIGSIAVFNDAIRDGLKGSVFDPKDAGYINGSVNKATAGKLIFGLLGGEKTPGISWSVDGAMVINYMSSHDNNTLWDKLHMTCPDASEEELLAMNRLGAGVVMIARGTPFFLAGEEMLRTKGGDGNSYASSDAVNNLDWDALTPQSEAWHMAEYYRELIALRRSNAFFTTADVSAALSGERAILVTWSQNGKTVACAVINPDASSFEAALPEGNWSVLFGSAEDGTVVPGRSVTVFVT